MTERPGEPSSAPVSLNHPWQQPEEPVGNDEIRVGTTGHAARIEDSASPGPSAQPSTVDVKGRSLLSRFSALFATEPGGSPLRWFDHRLGLGVARQRSQPRAASALICAAVLSLRSDSGAIEFRLLRALLR